MDQTPTCPVLPTVDELTRLLHTPLGEVTAAHADAVEAVVLRVVPAQSRPAVAVSAFNSSI